MSASPSDPTDAAERGLSEAAESVADGYGVDVAVNVDGESGRVMGNLARLSALRQAFRRLDQDGETDFAGETRDLPREWGHLRIAEALGRGGFGTVYRAYDPLLEREVALKLRREDRSNQEASPATRGYIDEARRLARVRHPNVLAVHGAGIHDGRAGLWSDLIEGESLEQRLSRGPLSRDELLALASQLLQALRAIHDAGLVHGDLKAANVMYDDGRAVLMDFGAAHAVGERPRQGSVDCMAPELLAGERGDARGDLYSLGALLRRAAGAEDGPSLRRCLGRSFAALIEDLMATKPDHRPEAAQAAQRLQAITSAPARRRRRLGVGLVIGSLLIGLLVSLVALQRVREARERSDRIKELLVSGIQNAAPTRQTGPASLQTMLDYLASEAPERLQDFPEALADMRLVIGSGMADLGEVEEGLLVAEVGLQVLREQPDVTDLHLANAYNLVAIMRGKLGRTADARQAAEQAIHLLQQLPEGDQGRRVGLIRTRSLLGNLLTDEGDWLGAVAAHRANLADRTALLGPDATGLAVDEYNLGTAQTTCGDFKGALQNLERAAERLRDAGAADSARMAYVLHGQAVALLRLGRLEASADMADRADALYQRVLGPQHVSAIRLAIFRTEWLRLSGEPEQAYARYRELVADPATQALLNTSMRLYGVDMLVDAGRYAEARVALDEVRANQRPLDLPLQPYIDAVRTWIDAQADDGVPAPLDATTAAARIRAATLHMRDSGYGQLPQLARMDDWVARLDR